MTQAELPLTRARHSYTDDLLALFLSRPGEWFDGLALAKIAGAYAWRSRVSDARMRLEGAGKGTIENSLQRQRDGSVRSLYRYVSGATA